jgi:hypothetical protein
VETLLRRLTGMGITRGFGGSRPWMIVGMVAVGLRTIRRMANPAPEVLYRTKVKPGDVFEITSTPSLTRRQRKRAAKRTRT